MDPITFTPPASTPAPVTSPTQATPELKFGSPPPPQVANVPDAGLVNNLMKGDYPGALYDAAKGITQAIDKPFLKFAALAPQAYDTLTGNTSAVANGQSTGYDFGDFFGKSTPIMSGFKLTNPITDAASWFPIADTAGTTLEAGSWFITPGTGAGTTAGMEGAKTAASTLLGKAGDVAKGIGTFLAKKAPFSTAQGAGQGLQALGQGQSPQQAFTTGAITGLATATTMKVLDVIGGTLASGLFWKSALRTQAGQFFSKQLDSIGKTIDDSVTRVGKSKVATAFKEQYNIVQDRVNNALTSFLGGVQKQIPVPSAEEWIPGIVNQIASGMNATRNKIQEGFDKVFGSGTMITVADNTRSAYDAAVKQINDLATGPGWPAVKDQETRAAMVGPSLAPNLYGYLDMIKTKILDPITQGAGFDMKELNNMMHFVDVSGTPGEQGIANTIRTALYKDVESGLATMGKDLTGNAANLAEAKGQAMLTAWNAAKESYRKYGNTMEAKFTSLWKKMNSPTTLANEFLGGNILKDPTQMKELESLIGVDGIATLRSTIMHTALGNAISQFSKLVRVGVPASYDEARKAASAELQKYIDVAVDSGVTGFNPMSAEQVQWLKDAQTLITNTDAAKLATSLATGAEGMTKQAIAGGSDVLERARSVFEAAGTPSKFAESIYKMTSIDDVKAALSFLKSPDDKAFVGLNLIKDMFTKFTSALSRGASPDEWESIAKGITNIGGADKKEVFNELFGQSPETTKLAEAIDTATKALQAIKKSPDISVLRSAGNAVVGVLFAMAGHPIIAVGLGRSAVRDFSAKEAQVFDQYFGKSEADLYAEMQKSGKLTVSGLQGVLRKVGSFLRSRAVKFTAGQSTAEETGDIMAPQQESEQPLQFTTDESTPLQ